MLHLTTVTCIFLAARVWTHLGEAARARGQYDEAIYDFSRARELDPAEAAVSQYNLGTVYRRLGRYGEAERAVRQALAVWDDPVKLAAGYDLLAGLRADRGRYEEALRNYDRALALDPANTGTILLDRALVFDAERRFGEAEADLRRALTVLDPTRTISCLNSLGLVAYHQRRYRDAEEWLRRAITLREETAGPEHPDLAASLTNLGAVYFAERRYSEAEAVLTRSLDIQSRTLGAGHPNTAATMMEYAKLLRATSRKSEAARWEAQARGAQNSFRGYTVDIGVLK